MVTVNVGIYCAGRDGMVSLLIHIVVLCKLVYNVLHVYLLRATILLFSFLSKSSIDILFMI